MSIECYINITYILEKRKKEGREKNCILFDILVNLIMRLHNYPTENRVASPCISVLDLI